MASMCPWLVAPAFASCEGYRMNNKRKIQGGLAVRWQVKKLEHFGSFCKFRADGSWKWKLPCFIGRERHRFWRITHRLRTRGFFSYMVLIIGHKSGGRLSFYFFLGPTTTAIRFLCHWCRKWIPTSLFFATVFLGGGWSESSVAMKNTHTTYFSSFFNAWLPNITKVHWAHYHSKPCVHV